MLVLDLGREALAQGVGTGDKKLLFIFMRGGNDGVNTLIPHGDTAYSPINRPSLYLSPANRIDLGNNFASLHGRMQPIMEVFDQGELALIHRVGYTDQSRSHFDSQDFWEKGVPNNPNVKDGLFYRQLREMMDLSDPGNSFAAATIDNSAFTALKGDNPFPNFTASSQFNFLGNTDERTKFLGQLPSSKGAGDGRGMLGLYGESGLDEAFFSRNVHASGTALGGTLSTLAAAQGDYTPENSAVYPTGSFGNRLQECAMLFKRTEVRILGTEIGGFDTHSNQGALNGSQGNLLESIAQGFQALRRDLQDQWDDLVVVTMSEFGRTSKENGSNGTDHAEAGPMMVAGGGVNGGVYNCDSSTWLDQDLFSKNNRYVARKTDFRAVFGEIFMKHFGDSAAQLETVMPGYGDDAIANPGEFTQLGIL